MICDKVKYESYDVAKKAAVSLGTRQGQAMQAYKCRDCVGYHITTIKKKQKGLKLSVKYKHDSTKPLPKDIHIPEPSKKKSSDGQKSLPLSTYKPFAYLRDKKP